MKNNSREKTAKKKRENNLNGRSLDKLSNKTLLRVVIALRLTHGCKQFILIKSITYIDDNVKTLNLKTECFRSTRYILPPERIRM